MSRGRDLLVSGLVLLAGRRRGLRVRPAEPRILEEPPERNPRAESAAIVCLFLGALCAAAFPVVYFVGAVPAKTQLFGLSLGLALLFVAAALVIVSQTVVPTEESEHDYPPREHVEEQEYVEQLVEESGQGFTRRRLFKLGLVSAGGALGVAALTPAISFGPLRVRDFYGTPWRKGRRLVDENGKPLRAADIEQKTFYTAFPEGADQEEQGSPLVVVRLEPSTLRLPPKLHGYDANGIVAYSKICTHAGCAISLYRVPTFAPTEPRPALVCPCHYSTFDPADGGSVTFGPAGRALPMLPLEIDRDGNLRARGNFDGPVGPSWWGVRERRPSP
ncbi:MAG TPA: Rieske 2Fe-2S domain-containing protein [Gaiellaceae bacterium]|nr:Rieske 2Fe-2S domain-containing protein [Gaiellaceae bacterium]